MSGGQSINSCITSLNTYKRNDSHKHSSPLAAEHYQRKDKRTNVWHKLFIHHPFLQFTAKQRTHLYPDPSDCPRPFRRLYPSDPVQRQGKERKKVGVTERISEEKKKGVSYRKVELQWKEGGKAGVTERESDKKNKGLNYRDRKEGRQERMSDKREKERVVNYRMSDWGEEAKDDTPTTWWRGRCVPTHEPETRSPAPQGTSRPPPRAGHPASRCPQPLPALRRREKTRCSEITESMAGYIMGEGKFEAARYSCAWVRKTWRNETFRNPGKCGWKWNKERRKKRNMLLRTEISDGNWRKIEHESNTTA